MSDPSAPDLVANRIAYGDPFTGPRDLYGAGSPDTVITAPKGSTYRNTSDGSFYVNTNGASTWASLGGGGIATGTGHPQGVLAAGVGSLYRDTNTGYLFRKYAGGVTAYGWYYERGEGMGSGYGPQYYNAVAWVDSSATLFATTGGLYRHGVMTSGGQAWNTQGSPGTISREYVSGYGWFIEFKSANTTGTVSGIRGNQSLVGWLDSDLDIVFKVRPVDDVTTVRYWLGIFSSTPTASDDNTANALGFRFSTEVPDAGWVGYARNSTGPTSGTTSSLGTVVADSVYRLRMRLIRSGTPTAYFSVNDGTEQALTSGIPATGGTQAPYITVEPRGNVARPIQWAQMDMLLGAQI